MFGFFQRTGKSARAKATANNFATPRRLRRAHRPQAKTRESHGGEQRRRNRPAPTKGAPHSGNAPSSWPGTQRQRSHWMEQVSLFSKETRRRQADRSPRQK